MSEESRTEDLLEQMASLRRMGIQGTVKLREIVQRLENPTRKYNRTDD